MRAKARVSFLLIMVLSLGLLLGGCRSSPVLEQIIYRQEAEETAPEEEMLDPEDEGRKDEQFDNKPEEEAETDRDTKEDQGLEGEKDEAEEAAEADHSEETMNAFDSSAAPAQATEDQNPETSESTPKPQADEQAEPDTEEESKYSNPEGEGGENENGNAAAGENIGGDAVTGKQIVDASGRTVDVPENVETVTATGAAAQFVELIGGDNRLIAADSGILSSALAMQAFPDITGIPAWWSDDADKPISPENFETLIAAHPDVCFELSGDNTFTNSQVERLAEAGISYVVLPGLSSADNLKQTAALIAEVLGGEAAEKAAAYTGWVDDVISDVSDKTAGTDLTSLYIADWDSAASYQLSDTAG